MQYLPRYCKRCCGQHVWTFILVCWVVKFYLFRQCLACCWCLLSMHKRSEIIKNNKGKTFAWNAVETDLTVWYSHSPTYCNILYCKPFSFSIPYSRMSPVPVTVHIDKSNKNNKYDCRFSLCHSRHPKFLLPHANLHSVYLNIVRFSKRCLIMINLNSIIFQFQYPFD